MRYVVSKMTMGDIPRVVEIEKLAYPTSQWPASAYRHEIQDNAWAHYIVLRDAEIAERAAQVAASEPQPRRNFPFGFLAPARMSAHDPAQQALIGYAGLWLTVDEAHITTIATHPNARRRGLGELLLVSLFDIGYQIGARWMTLEVRVTNEPAKALYHKYGFKIVSTRPRYYTDNNEDAYIMWTDEITTPDCRRTFNEHKDALYARLRQSAQVAS
ncbi:MAG: ribosomal protein S18-alanine N-acetyltransferase [Ktedonobacterales bacterium]|nr:ribosomal protein S18-alanine N-acetyltransferase [Ktedonobacterales bacterium]